MKQALLFTFILCLLYVLGLVFGQNRSAAIHSFRGRIGLLSPAIAGPVKLKVAAQLSCSLSTDAEPNACILARTVWNSSWWEGVVQLLDSATIRLVEDSVIGHVHGLLDSMATMHNVAVNDGNAVDVPNHTFPEVPMATQSTAKPRYRARSRRSTAAGYESVLPKASQRRMDTASRRTPWKDVSQKWRINNEHPLRKNRKFEVVRMDAREHVALSAPSYEPDCKVLMDLYDFTSGPQWSPFNWGSPLPSNFSTACCSLNLGGIFCEPGTGRVLEILLSSNGLVGTIPPSLGNLAQLEELWLDGNSLTGAIPSSLGNLSSLEVLVLFLNQLTGSIPESLGNLSSLVAMDLDSNSLTGEIPNSIGKLVKLTFLALFSNQLTGRIPSSLGNLKGLQSLQLAENRLTGSIPNWIGGLLNLQDLRFEANDLSGSIPDSLGNLSELQVLVLVGNRFTGPIPASLGSLSSLKTLELCPNGLTGSIPSTFSRLTALQRLQFDSCGLTGQVPDLFRSMSDLELLTLSTNNFEGKLPDSLQFLQDLRYLDVSANNFDGPIPSFIGQLGQLQTLDLHGNKFSGPIPVSIGNLSQLHYLDLHSNHFESAIPDIIGSLSQLLTLDLSSNNLVGTIPSSIGSLTLLTSLSLHANLLQGFLPDSLGNLADLQFLDLSVNNISGSFSCFSLPPNIQSLNLQNNQLFGAIPQCICNVQSLSFLYLGVNHFSAFPDCSTPSLSLLDLSSNNISFFPFDRIVEFQSLKSLDLSNNVLHGKFPLNVFLGGLRLSSLSLAYNNYEDALPIYGCSFWNGDQVMTVNGSTGLEVVDLSGNTITGIPGLYDVTTGKPCGFPGYPSLSVLSLQHVAAPSLFPGSVVNLAGSQGFFPYPSFSLLDISRIAPGLVSVDVSHNDLDAHLDYALSLPLLVALDLSHNRIARLSSLPEADKRRFSYDPTTFYAYSVQMTCLQALVDGDTQFQADPSFFDYENCVCRLGYFGKPPNCSTCPENADCSLTFDRDSQFLDMEKAYMSSGNIVAQPGFYASPPVTYKEMANNQAYPTAIEICDQAGTPLTPCQADTSRRCISGYEGRLCARCTSGYFRAGDRCHECPDDIVIYGIVLVIVAICIVAWAFFVGPSSSGAVKILVFFWQSFLFIRAPMPTNLYLFTHNTSSSTTLSFAGPECVFANWGYRAQYIFSVVAPFGALAIVGLIWVLGRICGVPPSQRTAWLDRCRRAGIFLFLLLYMPAVSAVFAPLSCTKDPGNGERYIQFNPAERCSSALQANSWVLLLVYCFGVPGFFGYRLWKTRVLWSSSGSDPRARYVYGILVGSFREGRLWWEFVVTMRRIVLVAAYVLIPRLSEYLTLLVVLLFVSASGAQAVAVPYGRSIDNWAEIVSLGLLLVNLVCSVQSQVLGVYDVDDAGTLVFVLNILFSATLVAMLLHTWLRKFQRFRQRISGKSNLAASLLNDESAESL
eukprot:ANDGO_07420.mRNA.1 MDIS1-interacting receptor like kinase 2